MKNGTNRPPQSNKIAVRLSDTHLQQLNRYREKTGADAERVINTLIQSYIQRMIDSGDTIPPEFPAAAYTRLVFDGPCFHVKQGDVYDQFAAWLRNEAPEQAKETLFLMWSVVKERESHHATVMQFPKRKTA